MKIATLTIDRGDRPKMIAQCKRLIKRQTRKPDLEIYIIEPSRSGAIDIVPRFRSGWLEAKKNNIDIIVVIESDDWYSKDYIFFCIKNFEISEYHNSEDVAMGGSESFYYNICNQTWQIHKHQNRASLYTTFFYTSALNDFQWPKDDYKFLDIPLWKHFKKSSTGISNPFQTIGIKHNEGIRAGIGHKSTMRNKDRDFKYLESIIGGDVGFYKNFCNG